MKNSLEGLNDLTKLKITLKNAIISLKKEINECNYHKRKSKALLEDNETLKSLYDSIVEKLIHLEEIQQQKEKVLESKIETRKIKNIQNNNKDIINKNEKLKNEIYKLQKMVKAKNQELKKFEGKDYINLQDKYSKAEKNINASNVKKTKYVEIINEQKQTLSIFRKHLKQLTTIEGYQEIINELIKLREND